MQIISKNRWLLFSLVALGVVVWMLLAQSQLPALSAPFGIGAPG
jgi:hypothetical protein